MEGPRKVNNRKLQNSIAAFQQPKRWQSIWQMINTLVPYAVLWYGAYWSLSVSYWMTLPIVTLLAGFQIRLFIIFHDCGHGSFFRSRKANTVWGIITGILTFTPYHRWRDSHARHHGTSGNLDKRGQGDVWMMTLTEYQEAPRSLRIKYRLYRNPFIMFLLGPLLITLVSNRIPPASSRRSDRISIHSTNAAIVALTAVMIWLVGWQPFLIIQLVSLFLAHVAGVWLFYVQHQFEGVYWERNADWDFVKAALEGGSFYRLPAILRWFTGNIGFHHIHHLNSRIPNYNLPRCQRTIADHVPHHTIGLLSSLKSLKFRLFDEASGRMISFDDIKHLQRDST